MLNIVVNPNAHRGKVKKLLVKIEERLKEEGVEYRIRPTEKKGDATRIARELSAAGETSIVAVGGDGTFNEVMCGIDPARTVLGLIPAGTGNDFAAAAKIPEGLPALDLILHGEPKYTDFLECNDGMRSINIAGLGIDVDILKRCERMKGGERSKYFRSLLVSLLKYRGSKIAVTADGERKEYNAYIAAACNGTQFGGGIPICPPALLDDGKMDLVVVESPKRSKLLFELIRLMKGKILTRPIAHRVLCEEAEIVPERRDDVQYDGELIETERLTAKVVSGVLRMYRG